jgi:hypothetical protein
VKNRLINCSSCKAHLNLVFEQTNFLPKTRLPVELDRPRVVSLPKAFAASAERGV